MQADVFDPGGVVLEARGHVSSPGWHSKRMKEGSGNILIPARVKSSSARNPIIGSHGSAVEPRSTSMSLLSGSRDGLSSEINVTPMIDVLLVLLIIFMVILPHHFWGERADIPSPTNETQPQGPDPTVVIQLHDRGLHSMPGLTINEQEVAWRDLDTQLREIFAHRVQQVAFFKGDPEIDFQYVADVLDTAHHAGVDRVGLLGGKE
jgi:biopolymer transport protein ExbD